MALKIAVIGAGIFGCTSAIELSKSGFDVTLFEARDGILKGATRNSQNRLHLGLHYPRDLPTAKQSKRGYSQFVNKFPRATRLNFDNYYALASQRSKTGKQNFVNFCLQAGISIEEVPPANFEMDLRLNPAAVAGLWKSYEGVIDIDTLSQLLVNELDVHGTTLNLSRKVNKLTLNGKKWQLEASDNFVDNFDWIVRATYGQNQMESNLENLSKKNYKFHQTMILEIKSPVQALGFTVVDGDFLTILPKGFSDNFLVYAPSISVRNELNSNKYPNFWHETSRPDQERFTDQILNRLYSWLPGFEVSDVVGVLQTVRSLDPDVLLTDRRTSNLRLIAPRFIDIWSGKIDHCVDIASDVKSLVTHNK